MLESCILSDTIYKHTDNMQYRSYGTGVTNNRNTYRLLALTDWSKQ